MKKKGKASQEGYVGITGEGVRGDVHDSLLGAGGRKGISLEIDACV